VEFAYEERRPPALARFVESIWYARGRIDYRRERIAPTGSTVAVVVLGDPIRPVAGAGPAFVARGCGRCSRRSTSTRRWTGPVSRPRTAGLLRVAIRRADRGQVAALKRTIEAAPAP
jgi:hypothetical protein